MEQRFMSLEEMCEYIGCGKTKGREIAKSGVGNFTLKLGNRFYIDKDSFDKFIKNCIKFSIPI